MKQDNELTRFVFEPSNLQELLQQYPLEMDNVYPIVFQKNRQGTSYVKMVHLKERFSLEQDDEKRMETMTILSKIDSIRKSICYFEESSLRKDFTSVVYVDPPTLHLKETMPSLYIAVLPTNFAGVLKELMTMPILHVSIGPGLTGTDSVEYLVSNPFSDVSERKVMPVRGEVGLFVGCVKLTDSEKSKVAFIPCIEMKNMQKLAGLHPHADLFQVTVDHGWIRVRGIEHPDVMCEKPATNGLATGLRKFLLDWVPGDNSTPSNINFQAGKRSLIFNVKGHWPLLCLGAIFFYVNDCCCH